jgi:hypothetical protein
MNATAAAAVWVYDARPDLIPAWEWLVAEGAWPTSGGYWYNGDTLRLPEEAPLVRHHLPRVVMLELEKISIGYRGPRSRISWRSDDGTELAAVKHALEAVARCGLPGNPPPDA